MTNEPVRIDLSGITDPAEVAGFVKSAISQAFTVESEARSRQPHHLGISALSGCTRRAAFALSATPPSDQPEASEGRAANLGTWIHGGLNPRISDRFAGGQSEVPVILHAAGLDIPGTADVSVPGAVMDLKTVGEWRLQQVRRSGPFPEHVMQVAAYAFALGQAGQKVQWLILHYLDRTSGDDEVFVIRFENHHLALVLNRVEELRQWAEEDPDTAPRRTASSSALLGPGYSFACDECPWLRRCWGPDAQPSARIRHDHDDAEVEELLLEYIRLNAVEGPAKRRKAEIAELLGSAKYGVYGTAQYHRAPDTIVDDPWAALRILRTLGYEIPQRPHRGQLSIKLATANKPRKPRKPRKKDQ